MHFIVLILCCNLSQTWSICFLNFRRMQICRLLPTCFLYLPWFRIHCYAEQSLFQYQICVLAFLLVCYWFALQPKSGSFACPKLTICSCVKWQMLKIYPLCPIALYCCLLLWKRVFPTGKEQPNWHLIWEWHILGSISLLTPF